MTIQQTFEQEKSELDLAIVKIRTAIDLHDKPTEKNLEFLHYLNNHLYETMLFLKYIH